MLQQQMQQMQQQMQQMQQQMQQMQQQMVVTAQASNGHATQDDHPLVRLPHPDTGAAPPIFPATVGALRAYSANNCSTLINFYGLGPVPVALTDRRTLVAHHIGCLAV